LKPDFIDHVLSALMLTCLIAAGCVGKFLYDYAVSVIHPAVSAEETTSDEDIKFALAHTTGFGETRYIKEGTSNFYYLQDLTWDEEILYVGFISEVDFDVPGTYTVTFRLTTADGREIDVPCKYQVLTEGQAQKYIEEGDKVYG